MSSGRFKEETDDGGLEEVFVRVELDITAAHAGLALDGLETFGLLFLQLLGKLRKLLGDQIRSGIRGKAVGHFQAKTAVVF